MSKDVKLPLDKIKPFLVPAGVRDSVTVAGKSLFVDAQTTLLRIDPDATWYGAGVEVKGLSAESEVVPAEGAVAPAGNAAPPPVKGDGR